MRPPDWAVLAITVLLIVGYGLYKGRRSNTMSAYLLANRTMPWWAMGLSIMATQASGITFIGTTGQAYIDGMQFVQFYFGLPLAMVILSATLVPLFRRSGAYTASAYLEQRFDGKTRTLTCIIFLIQRGLGVGLALYAPAIVLSVMLGWSERWTIMIMGVLMVGLTIFGGMKAITWTDVQQMAIIFLGIAVSLGVAILMLPADVSIADALYVAGASGKLQAVDMSFDWGPAPVDRAAPALHREAVPELDARDERHPGDRVPVGRLRHAARAAAGRAAPHLRGGAGMGPAGMRDPGDGGERGGDAVARAGRVHRA